ncbi:hypothetical protein AMATHDRAFT_8644 [Amanita thiersii Skay4041]|uniref:Uncharacterized protein n=1 Tax=Amanita thiersii Skay4041 TaxID=703135 RepID=A0A2A9NDK5_9AGAR|nr:hypothetical protein AMATHDRAFT_8644 [Amanita thiersii Skay4041]
MDSEDHYQVTFREYQRQWAQQQVIQQAQQANQANWNSQQVNQQYITQVPAGLPPISEEQPTQSPPTTHLGKGPLSGRQIWMKLKVYISKLFEVIEDEQQSALERQVWELFCEELGLSPDSDEPLTDEQEVQWQQIRR